MRTFLANEHAHSPLTANRTDARTAKSTTVVTALHAAVVARDARAAREAVARAVHRQAANGQRRLARGTRCT